MKLFTYLITLFLIIPNLYCDEVNEEQIKVAYTYNFMKNISWQNEAKIDKYRLLIVSKNDSLKNMFSMLASRKNLKDKNLFKPLRYILTGADSGPNILGIYPLIKNYLGEIVK